MDPTSSHVAECLCLRLLKYHSRRLSEHADQSTLNTSLLALWIRRETYCNQHIQLICHPLVRSLLGCVMFPLKHRNGARIKPLANPHWSEENDLDLAMHWKCTASRWVNCMECRMRRLQYLVWVQCAKCSYGLDHFKSCIERRVGIQ